MEGTQSGAWACVAPDAAGRRAIAWPPVDLDFATATELTAALRERRVSSRELLEHALARVEKYNPALNAVVALDVERARKSADAADAVTASGATVPPLHGLPMTVKDVWETEGLVTTSGAPELSDYVPERDALTVSRLKAAGAVVFGKTNTPLYAGDLQTFNEVYGVTNNPWDTTRTVGGSSGGAAAAVAAGFTAVELGSDIGGSIRNPAHYNGVYGLKPSWGIVPSRGHIPGPPGSLVEPDVNCGGPLARSIDDLALVLGIVAGPLPEDAAAWRLELDRGPAPDRGRLRVATVFDEGGDLLPLSGSVRSGLDDFAGRLADAGAAVDPVPLPVPLAVGLRSWQELVLPIIGSAFPDDVFTAFAELESLDGDDPTAVAARSLAGRYRSWARANGLRQRQRAAWAKCFERYDVVLAPVMPTAAYPHDVDGEITDRSVDVDGTAVPHMLMMAWMGAIGSALLPVVTLPVQSTPENLPVGVQVIGPFLSDLHLLRVAGLLNELAGRGFRPPPGFS
jgi:amidase